MFTQGYIGVSSDIDTRLDNHHKRTKNEHLKCAIKKYGWDNLIKQVLIISNNQYCLNVEEKLRPIDNVGWNIISGGGMPPSKKGITISKETRARMAVAQKGRIFSKEHREKLSVANTGKTYKPHSEERKQKISAAQKGKIVSAETRERMSRSGKGRICSPKTRAKVSESLLKYYKVK